MNLLAFAQCEDQKTMFPNLKNGKKLAFSGTRNSQRTKLVAFRSILSTGSLNFFGVSRQSKFFLKKMKRTICFSHVRKLKLQRRKKISRVKKFSILCEKLFSVLKNKCAWTNVPELLKKTAKLETLASYPLWHPRTFILQTITYSALQHTKSAGRGQFQKEEKIQLLFSKFFTIENSFGQTMINIFAELSTMPRLSATEIYATFTNKFADINNRQTRIFHISTMTTLLTF